MPDVLSPHGASLDLDIASEAVLKVLLFVQICRQGPRFSMRMVIKIFCSDTVLLSICQTQQIFTNIERAMLTAKLILAVMQRVNLINNFS